MRFGDYIDVAIPNAEVLEYCTPFYVEFPGWLSDISGIRRREDLPPALENLISFVEKQTGASVCLLSVGPDREQTIGS